MAHFAADVHKIMQKSFYTSNRKKVHRLSLSPALVNLSLSLYNKTMEEDKPQVLVFPYPDRDDGAAVTIKRTENPAGTQGSAVLTLGTTLNGNVENPAYVVHIPLSLANDVGRALISLSTPQRSNSVWSRGRKSLL